MKSAKRKGKGTKGIKDRINVVQSMNDWTDEEIERIFACFKIYDTKWSTFVHKFPGRTESNIKNKFYSLLKKVATQAQMEDPISYGPYFIRSKKNLIQFVDAAIMYGKQLSSKRGRKRNIDRQLASKNAILFPLQDNLSCKDCADLPLVSTPIPKLLAGQEELVKQSPGNPNIETSSPAHTQLKDKGLENPLELHLSTEEYLEGIEKRMEVHKKWLEAVLSKGLEGGELERKEIILPRPITFKSTNPY